MKDQKKTTERAHSELVQILLDCAAACETCAAACLYEEDPAMMARCIETDRDCADICTLGARLLLRDSENANHYLTACVEACRLCAEECKKHNNDHCRQCAEACDRCADACVDQHSVAVK